MTFQTSQPHVGGVTRSKVHGYLMKFDGHSKKRRLNLGMVLLDYLLDAWNPI